MITSKEEYRYYLSQDRVALGIKRSNSVFGFLKAILFPNPILVFEKKLRKLEYIQNVVLNKRNLFLKTIGYIRFYTCALQFKRLSRELGFSIPTNCFGPGLSIAHYGTIIVNKEARIGSNCRIHACVNIGASGGNDKAPIIGDNVYIGPSVVIFGNIEIANSITIGANATVNKSFMNSNVTIAGTPAKVVKEDTLNWIQIRNNK